MIDGPLPGTDSGVTARRQWLLRLGPAPTPVFCDPVACDPVLCDGFGPFRQSTHRRHRRGL